MLPHLHFIAGLFMGAIGYDISILTVWEAFLVAFLAVAIDLDHYISYAIKNRSYSLSGMWDECIDELKHDKCVHRTFIHKWYGILSIFVFLSIVYFVSHKIGYILIAAYGSHMLLDYAHVLKLTSKEFKIVKIFGHEFSYNLQVEIFFLITLIISLLLLF